MCQYENPNKANPGKDDTGTNDVDLKCMDGSWALPDFSGWWGDWGDVVTCPTGTAISGMNVQIEASLGADGDDTALNGVQFHCSDVFGNIFFNFSCFWVF